MTTYIVLYLKPQAIGREGGEEEEEGKSKWVRAEDNTMGGRWSYNWLFSNQHLKRAG